MTTKIASWGNGLGLHLPKKLVSETGLEEGSEVQFSIRKDGSIIIEPVEKELSLKELLKGANPKNRHPEFWTDKPQGREIW